MGWWEAFRVRYSTIAPRPARRSRDGRRRRAGQRRAGDRWRLEHGQLRDTPNAFRLSQRHVDAYLVGGWSFHAVVEDGLVDDGVHVSRRTGHPLHEQEMNLTARRRLLGLERPAQVGVERGLCLMSKIAVVGGEGDDATEVGVDRAGVEVGQGGQELAGDALGLVLGVLAMAEAVPLGREDGGAGKTENGDDGQTYL